MDGRVLPRQIATEAIGFRVHHLRWESITRLVVDALVELAAKQLDAEDGEDEPKDEAHEEHVENGRDGEHQRVHHNLTAIESISSIIIA